MRNGDLERPRTRAKDSGTKHYVGFKGRNNGPLRLELDEACVDALNEAEARMRRRAPSLRQLRKAHS
eukprot:6208527-Pleurochrysis_carterae.AAC.1